jgi:hypothetical protein
MKKRLLQWLTVRRLATVILFLSLFTLTVRFAIDPDMWWHLRTGQYIVENQTIPHEDVFSYTVRGRRWITHEWLTEVMMYGVYQAGGRPALILTAAATITAAFALVYIQCKNRPYIASFVVLLAALASAPTWGPRPQMATFFLAALLMTFLESYRRQGNRRVLWMLPPLMALWVNLHGGFFLGLGLIGVVLGVDAGARIIGHTSDRTLTWSRWKALALTLIFCVLATLLNPNGHHMLTYPFETLGSSAMQEYIQEWHSPDFHNVIYLPFAIFLLGSAGVLALRARQRLDLLDLFLYLGFALAGLLSVRHIPIFSVVAAPVVSRAFGNVGIRSSRRSNRFTLNWALLLILSLLAGLRIVQMLQTNAPLEANTYPVDALAYIEEHDLADRRIYNSYNWGGYLIWRGIPVYIDGRADVYMDAFMSKYRQTYALEGDWRAPLNEYDVTYVLIEENAPLSHVLEEAPEWNQVYQDEVAVIFLRESQGG